MNKGIAYFLDGHNETITEYNILDNGQITFTTESGEYLHTSNNLKYRPGELLSSCCGFYKKDGDKYTLDNIIPVDRIVLKAEEKLWKPHPNCKLTAAQAAYVKYTFTPYDREYGVKALAKKFGVDTRTISRVIEGQTWR